MRSGSNHRSSLLVVVALVSAGGLATTSAEPGRYLDTEEFVASVLDPVPESSDTLFVDSALRSRIESALGHSFPRLRVHYWKDEGTTAWVLDEIGKTEPITIGVAIAGDRVKSVRVLEFRESRGWEVQYPFYTDRYSGVGLGSDGRIDRRIDGITGATLSAIAVEKVVRVALILNESVKRQSEAVPL